jgi:hypothetical protein
MEPRDFLRVLEKSTTSFMFVPCIIKRSRNDQQYALIVPSFILYTGSYMFRHSLPSSGSFLDPSELLEIQI